MSVNFRPTKSGRTACVISMPSDHHHHQQQNNNNRMTVTKWWYVCWQLNLPSFPCILNVAVVVVSLLVFFVLFCFHFVCVCVCLLNSSLLCVMREAHSRSNYYIIIMDVHALSWNAFNRLLLLFLLFCAQHQCYNAKSIMCLVAVFSSSSFFLSLRSLPLSRHARLTYNLFWLAYRVMFRRISFVFFFLEILLH